MSLLNGPVLALLQQWLPGNDQNERPQVQLSTVDAEGRPDLRTVLLSSWADDGFTFHTDSASRKVEQLAANPAVALLVLWPGFTRQLVIRGRAKPLSNRELETAYAARSPYLQQLAWLNTQELAQRDRPARTAIWQRFTADETETMQRPSPTWTGYRVLPDRVTFWQSDAQGPSHRVEYRPDENGTWQEHHLAG